MTVIKSSNFCDDIVYWQLKAEWLLFKNAIAESGKDEKGFILVHI